MRFECIAHNVMHYSGLVSYYREDSMSIYAAPRRISKIKNCYFYHTMILPGIGTVQGNWDLNQNLRKYLGDVNFSEKRVLDVGCASGVLSFYMEQQGAEVISFDLDKNGDWDMVPFAKYKKLTYIRKDRKKIIDRLNNAYWLAHRLLDSKAKVVYGSVYAIPDAIGQVDISVYGSILLHLRDPFLALQSGLRLTRQVAIISEVLRDQQVKTTEPYLGFLPDARTVEPKDTWWDIRPEWVIAAIGVLGFEDTEIIYHTQRFEGRDIGCYTIVGRRTHGK
jgi:SAM-dependent methyltransferase